MSEKEYADSIGSMYGSTMRKESESSFFIFDVSAPGEITEAAVLPAGTGSASKNGKKASFRIALCTPWNQRHPSYKLEKNPDTARSCQARQSLINQIALAVLLR